MREKIAFLYARNFKNPAILSSVLLLFVAGTGHSFGQLLASWNADQLSTSGTPLSLTSWIDGSGNGNAATLAGAQAAIPGNSVIAPVTYGIATTGYNSTFDGHNYVDFNVAGSYGAPSHTAGTGLATTSNLFTGSASRTVVLVYANTSVPISSTSPLAGEVGTNGTDGTWFELQSRNAGVTGDPYLAGFAADAGSGQAITTNRLTFAIATYSGGVETLYWAYGTSLAGAIGSTSDTTTLNTGTQAFELGFDTFEPSGGNTDIAQALVLSNGMNAVTADAEIQSLRTYYSTPLPVSVPEPSTYAMMLAGLATLGFCVRRKRAVNHLSN